MDASPFWPFVVYGEPPAMPGVKLRAILWNKTPFDRVEMRSANCTKQSKGGQPNGWQQQSISYKVELQVSYSVCAKVSAQDNLWGVKSGNRKDSSSVMWVEIGKILRQLCEWKEVKITEAQLCPDHIHMLVEIPQKMSVSSFVGYLKGKSSLMIHERHRNYKYK